MKLTTDQLRALRLLADAGPRGATDGLLVAHGFDADLLVGLVRDGLAAATPENVRAGARMIEAVRVRITGDGLDALDAG